MSDHRNVTHLSRL